MSKKDIQQILIYSLSGLIIWGIVALISPSKGFLVGKIVYDTFINALAIIIAVEIIIGLLQVWVKPETMTKLLGKEAGWKGLLLASTFPIIMGGSLFIIFPLAKTLREKGSSLACILAFLTAWGGKAPLLPLEIHFLGLKFALIRLALIIPTALLTGLLGEFILELWQKKSKVV
jgi:uncharacterized membrane protein YraQ (UPF0718 family)